MNYKHFILIILFFSTSFMVLANISKEDIVCEINRITEAKTWFEALNIKQTATDSEIKKQYFKISLIVHPDKYSSMHPDLVKKGELAFKKISEARYKRLTEAQSDESGADQSKQRSSSNVVFSKAEEEAIKELLKKINHFLSYFFQKIDKVFFK